MKRLSLILLLVVLLGAGCKIGNKKGGVDGGVFKTADAGSTWTQAAAVPTAQGMGTLATSDVLSLKLDARDKFYLYATTRDNGMVYSEDGAISWRLPRQSSLRDGSIYTIDVDPADSCVVYLAKGSRLYNSTDCMHTFNDEVYVESRGGINIVQVVLDWYTRGTVWVGLSNGDLLKSTDSGKSWRTVLKINKEISKILVSNKDSRVVLISTFDFGIQRTLDGGEHWEKLEGNLSDLTGADKVFNMTQTKDGGEIVIATQYGLLRSTDMGSNFEPMDLLTSPGQVQIRAVAVAPKDPHIIYYVTPGTFYRTRDGGTTWQTQKFPSSRVTRAIAVDPDDASVLYVGVAAPVK